MRIMARIGRRSVPAFFVPIALGLLMAAPATAQQAAGSIKSVTGGAFVVRGDQQISASVGQSIYPDDALKTASDGRLGLTLRDGTRLSLGASTEVQLNAFAYSPAEGRMGLAMKVLRGVAAYISGRIADLAPASVKIETPTSVIAVRGTHLLIGVDQP
jgi:hypothetical protein